MSGAAGIGAEARAASNRRTATRLALVVLGMFGFGYALVPLYDVFCEITGLNGKTGRAEAGTVDGVVDSSRVVRVDFLGSVNSALPWAFEPLTRVLEVHPGGIYEARYRVRNRSRERLVGRAVPSVTPVTAATYFDKTQCFCFTEQAFEPGESRDLSVRFVLRRGVPPDVHNVTLSYTFFPVEGSG